MKNDDKLKKMEELTLEIKYLKAIYNSEISSTEQQEKAYKRKNEAYKELQLLANSW